MNSHDQKIGKLSLNIKNSKIKLTLFWSKGEGECGVGNIEVVFPFKNEGDEIGGDPKAVLGVGDWRPLLEVG